MKSEYLFNYDMMTASVQLTVDRAVFTEEMAQDTLTFFSWDEEPDLHEDPIDEVVKKYAIMAIHLATKKEHNTTGVIADFEDLEGYYPVDGSHGIQLNYVEGIDISVSELQLESKKAV